MNKSEYSAYLIGSVHESCWKRKSTEMSFLPSCGGGGSGVFPERKKLILALFWPGCNSSAAYQAACLTSPLADISSLVLAVVVVPVAVVNKYRQAVFTKVIVRVTCGEHKSRRLMLFFRSNSEFSVSYEPAFQRMYLNGEPSIHSQPPSVMES